MNCMYEAGYSKVYLSKEVFVGAGGVMQPFNEQSKELFDGKTDAPDLVGSSACAAFTGIIHALAISVHTPIWF